MGTRALPDTGPYPTSIEEVIQYRLQSCCLAAFQRVAVLGLYGGGDLPAESDGVHRSALCETLQNGHLRGEHVAFVDRGDCALGFVFDTLCSVVDKTPRGVNHRL